MQFLNINILAILACGIAAMIIGFFWYGNFLFGKQWAKLVGLTQKDIESQKDKMPVTYGVMFAGALIMAVILALFIGFANAVTLTQGMTVAFLSWFGFVGAVKISDVLFSQKPLKLYYIEAGYYLATLLVMSIIITSWR